MADPSVKQIQLLVGPLELVGESSLERQRAAL